MSNGQTQSHGRLALKLVGIVVGMFGFGFALVPLYNVFCEITGLNGKTGGPVVIASEAQGVIDTQRVVTVEFMANVNAAAPWQFKPAVIKMRVHPGELYQTSYSAENLSGRSLLGQAVPSVAPGQAAEYFQKIECFCFARQAFGPGESKDMPLVFRIDPKLPADISTLTLSYTFFKLEDRDG